jgi:CheY-like chemotaxis protein
VALVLIVDDDPAIRSMLDELLSDEGYETLMAADGLSGIEIARERRPDLILMDLMLPGLDGAAATRLLKADPDTNWIHVIAMSAGTNLRLQADTLPADSVLGKPFDLDALLADVAIQTRQAEESRRTDVRST